MTLADNEEEKVEVIEEEKDEYKAQLYRFVGR